MITNVLNGPLAIEQEIHVKISGEEAGMLCLNDLIIVSWRRCGLGYLIRFPLWRLEID